MMTPSILPLVDAVGWRGKWKDDVGGYDGER
jgi:hypothetical protein